MAVFTNGEFAIEKPIFFASFSFLQPCISIVINLDAPSPSATTLFAKFNKTLFNAISKFLIFSSLILLILGCFDFPVEKIDTISFVLVSLSQLIALNVFDIFFFKSFFKISFGISASVKTYAKVVAMLGCIMPEPFATPNIFISLFPIEHSSIAILG